MIAQTRILLRQVLPEDWHFNGHGLIYTADILSQYHRFNIYTEDLARKGE